MKRIFDILLSSAGLLFLSPLMIGVAALIAASMGRPALFSQERPGLHGTVFRLYKFRTMKEAQTGDGEPLPDEQRLTALGRFLRSTSLDELPTLWNVLKGDMSLVGPRPLLVEYLGLYSEQQSRRHEVRPGITGWAQVNGRNAISWDEKFELDVWYVDNRSWLLDARIILMTLGKVLKSDGVSHPGQATMPRFTGNEARHNGDQA